MKTGWRVGKGSSKTDDRHVDILLVVPQGLRGPGTQRHAKSIAPSHCRISMYPESGALVLSMGMSRRSDSHLNINALPLDKENPARVLHQRKSQLEIGDLVYHFEHMLASSDSPAIVEQRNPLIRRCHPTRSLPHAALYAAPPQELSQVAGTLIHQSLNSGAFGLVSSGILVTTGAPVAIKEQVTRSRANMMTVGTEAGIATTFPTV